MNSSYVAYYRRWRELERNLVFISTTEFFKENKITRARKARAVCNLWKIYKCLFKPNCTRKSRNIDSARTLLIIYTRVTRLYLCYMKNAMSFFLILETNFISEDHFCIILAPAPNGDFRPRWAWSPKRLSSYKVVWWWRVRLVILSHTCVHLVCQILYLSPLPLLSFLMEGRWSIYQGQA